MVAGGLASFRCLEVWTTHDPACWRGSLGGLEAAPQRAVVGYGTSVVGECLVGQQRALAHARLLGPLVRVEAAARQALRGLVSRSGSTSCSRGRLNVPDCPCAERITPVSHKCSNNALATGMGNCRPPERAARPSPSTACRRITCRLGVIQRAAPLFSLPLVRWALHRGRWWSRTCWWVARSGALVCRCSPKPAPAGGLTG